MIVTWGTSTRLLQWCVACPPDMARCTNAHAPCAVQTITLSAGYVPVQITYAQYGGGSYLNLQWDGGVGLNQAIPLFRIFPFPPGGPTPVTATVNGVSAGQGCSAATVTLPTVPMLLAAPEPTSVSACRLLASSLPCLAPPYLSPLHLPCRSPRSHLSATLCCLPMPRPPSPCPCQATQCPLAPSA
jgi:hypothetical protein